jgi:hypothetical protein
MLVEPWQTREASTEEPLRKKTRISAYRQKSLIRNSSKLYKRSWTEQRMQSSEIPRLTLRADEIRLEHAQELVETSVPEKQPSGQGGGVSGRNRKARQGLLEGDPRTIGMAKKGVPQERSSKIRGARWSDEYGAPRVEV